MLDVPCLYNDITKIIEDFLRFEVVPRQTFETQWDKHPFSYIGKPRYSLDQMTTTLPFSNKQLSCGLFPNNICEVYCFLNGINERETWCLVAKLDNGVFAYYSAQCDYFGFDCQGLMSLILADNLDNLIENALCGLDRYYFYEFQSNFFN